MSKRDDCSCGTPGLNYAGPQEDCEVHGELGGLSLTSPSIDEKEPNMTELVYAQILVKGDGYTHSPIVERVSGGWQSGEHHYPHSVVSRVWPLNLTAERDAALAAVERVRPATAAGEVSALDGATRVPPEYEQASTAGEFAARWNAATDEARERWVVAMRDSTDTATRCFMLCHDNLTAERDAALAAVERVRARHVNDADGDCDACGRDGKGEYVPYPCPTIRALDGET